MKNIFSHIPENNGKKGKNVCRDVICMVNRWKNTGKIWEKIHENFTMNFASILPRTKTLCIEVFYPFFLFYRQKYMNKENKNK